jgi:hypothetical protein
MNITTPPHASTFQLRISDAGISGDYALNLLKAGPANADFAAMCADQAGTAMRMALELPAYESALDMAQRAADAFSAASDVLRPSDSVTPADVREATRLLRDGMNEAQYASDIAD